MALKKLVMFAIIVGISSTLETSSARRKSRFRREESNRNITRTSQNTSGPPVSQVIDNVSNLKIAETGELVFNVPDQHQQPNAQVIYNLKESLKTLKDACEQMAQRVNLYLSEHGAISEVDRDGYPADYHERVWNSTLILHRLKLNRLQRTLNRLIQKIMVGDNITDLDVTKAREDALDVVKYHKKLTVKMLEVVNSS